MKYSSIILISISAIALSGCSYFDKLAVIGEAPALSEIKNPVAQPGYRPVSLPMPEPEIAHYNANSLWQNGSRAFFKDQRASRVGDILTVMIDITDKAEFDNETERTRQGTENLGINSLGGYEDILKKLMLIPKDKRDGVNLANFFDLGSNSSNKGTGTVEREEKLSTKMAAIVTQSLPNGNLVIEGRQEIRVNFEVREIIVAGIIRPEDISSENTIPIAKIAEARVSYGGRGHLTDVQQARYGQQALDVMLPF